MSRNNEIPNERSTRLEQDRTENANKRARETWVERESRLVRVRLSMD